MDLRPVSRLALPLFHRLVLAAGLAALGVLVWKLDVRAVLDIVSRVGWGMLLLLALGLVPPLLNAAAWRLSFEPADGRSYRFTTLWSLWLAMDGVNYLVPTGSVAGEVARATLLGGSPPFEVRTASVVASRLGQTVAQIGIVLAGLVVLVAPLPAMARHGWVTAAAAVLLALLAAAAAAYLLLAPRLVRAGDVPGRAGEPPDGWVRRTPARLRLYFGRHRARFSGAVSLLAAAYAWNAVEAWWICRLIGLPVDARTALTIEVLSVAIDGLFFIVPAKIGTQELGKVAVFSLLGLPARFGFAFGIVRHVRELFWAAAGLAIYGARRRRAS
ncbi:MAG TPA: lysylphosphatidylglycerol synthase domain-containing protein [Thermoanaerobaculia bacterium]|nr:lysylphosphatidylglycerol synthase domain-containing protein [Thermoanaerobaculia bacterium]HQR66523.1 lysylphosphatidylglycerol synthase domain-containing protein [Thermoanaerobaculia bacterium]